MSNKIVKELIAESAKDACHRMVYVMEKTDEPELKQELHKTITTLCNRFGITVFGHFPTIATETN